MITLNQLLSSIIGKNRNTKNSMNLVISILIHKIYKTSISFRINYYKNTVNIFHVTK